MAVIDPADLPPTDVRPIFDRQTLPGGPWHEYRSIALFDAIRMRGDFLIRRPSDGWLIERQGGWVIIERSTGNIDWLNDTDFAATYVNIT